MDVVGKSDFAQWVFELKSRIRKSQLKAAIHVNRELMILYWDLGHDICLRQLDAVWGDGFFEQLSRELKTEFPQIKGFSVTNLKYCKQFYKFYSELVEICQQVDNKFQKDDHNEVVIRQQAADELYNQLIFQIPWFHQVQIFTKCNTVDEALFYVQKTIENGWSRAVLINFIEAGLFHAQGKSLNNFDKFLPDTQSDLAKETLKDPYIFDFLTLRENYREKDLEDALVVHITRFLLELGQGFAYLGRQYPIRIGKKERFMDLLFYHLKLRCFVVVELKTSEFEPEHAGKLSYYVTAVNHELKQSYDNPTIGLLICKTKDNIDVQYALESTLHPIGVSEYVLSKFVPDDMKSGLPTIEEIEDNLKLDKND